MVQSPVIPKASKQQSQVVNRDGYLFVPGSVQCQVVCSVQCAVCHCIQLVVTRTMWVAVAAHLPSVYSSKELICC